MTTGLKLFLWFHLVSTLTSSVLFATLLSHAKPLPFSSLLRRLLLLNALLPLLGPLLLTPLWWLVLNFPRRPLRRRFPGRAVALDLETLPKTPKTLLLKPLPELTELPEERFLALLQELIPLREPEQTRTLKRIAVDHPAATVRMVAIQLLNRERQDRERWITRLQEALRRTRPAAMAWLHAHIGWLFYRLAELELLEAGEKQEALERAESAFRLVCSMEPVQPAFWWAAAKIALARGDLEEARERLLFADRLGMPHALLFLPVLELAKRSGEWSLLKPLLAEASQSWAVRPWTALWTRRLEWLGHEGAGEEAGTEAAGPQAPAGSAGRQGGCDRAAPQGGGLGAPGPRADQDPPDRRPGEAPGDGGGDRRPPRG